MWGILWGTWAFCLCYFDIRYRRLPNWLTLPALALSLFWLTPGALVWPGLYLILAVLIGGIGGGDIKLAFPLGVAVALAGGVGAVLVAVLVASLLSLALTLIKQIDAPVPHGPGMLMAASICVFLA